jgi:DNA-binding NtrC family response regulator
MTASRTETPPVFERQTVDSSPSLPAPLALSGTSPAISHLTSQIRRVAPYFRTAMLTGERHCGDAEAAALLHRHSPLSGRPLLTLNAVDAELMLGDSFPPAAVTDAGMLFLTWPERLSRSAQMTLLRLLRNRKPLPPRIVIFAEHGLRPLVSTGNFSPELEVSLSALRITLPSLRDRGDDVPSLLTGLTAEAASRASVAAPQLTPALLDAASHHVWGENLKELRAVAELLAANGPAIPLGADALQVALEAVPTGPPADRRAPRLISLEQVVQEHVRAVLLACNGNKLRAAEVLGISRSTLYRMLENPASFSPMSLAS